MHQGPSLIKPSRQLQLAAGTQVILGSSLCRFASFSHRSITVILWPNTLYDSSISDGCAPNRSGETLWNVRKVQHRFTSVAQFNTCDSSAALRERVSAKVQQDDTALSCILMTAHCVHHTALSSCILPMLSCCHTAVMMEDLVMGGRWGGRGGGIHSSHHGGTCGALTFVWNWVFYYGGSEIKSIVCHAVPSVYHTLTSLLGTNTHPTEADEFKEQAGAVLSSHMHVEQSIKARCCPPSNFTHRWLNAYSDLKCIIKAMCSQIKLHVWMHLDWASIHMS